MSDSDDDDMDILPPMIGHSVKFERIPETPSVDSGAATKTAAAAKKKQMKRMESRAFDTNTTESQFSHFAKNKGQMMLPDLKGAMGLMGLGKGNDELATLLFKAIDSTGSNKISGKEYVHALECMVKGELDEKLKFAFKIMDAEKKGALNADDLKKVLSTFYRSYNSLLGVTEEDDAHQVNVKDVKEVVKTFDKNKSGDITESEWIAGIKAHPDIFSSLAHIVDPEAALKHWTKSAKIVDELARLLAMLEGTAGSASTKTVPAAGLPTDAPPVPPQSPAAGAPLHSAERTLPRLGTKTMMLDPEKGRPKVLQSMSHHLLLLKKHLDVMRSNMDHLKPVSALPVTLRARRASRAIKQVAQAGASQAIVASNSTIAEDDVELTKIVTNQDLMNTYTENDWSVLRQRMAAFEKAPVVAFGSPYWNTSLSIMQGIQLSAVRATSEGNRPLSRHDFCVRDKYTLKPSSISPGENDRDPVDRRVKFYDYAPRAFYLLRTSWGLTPREYITTCGPGQIISNLVLGSLTALSRMRSEGKSGDFFYTTGDSRYMLKTIAKREFQTFRDMLPEYVRHMTVDNLNSATDPTPGLNSLICKFCGLHKMKTVVNKRVEKIYFVIMSNCNPPDDMMTLHRRLDLKGSYRGRTAVKGHEEKRKLKQMPLNQKYNEILKDNDFDAMVHSIGSIRIGPKKTRLLRKIMNADVKFLNRHHIMDYSLIIGCHYKVKCHNELSRRPTTDFNDPSQQLREVLDARPSLKMDEINRGDYNQPKLVNFGFKSDNFVTAEEVSKRSSMADLGAGAASKQKPAAALKTHGFLDKKNTHVSLFSGRWQRKYFELHNMFLYYWDEEKDRKKDGGKKWKGCWNLLRVDNLKLDTDKKELTINFDDVDYKKGTGYTTKTVKSNDLSELREWQRAIQERLDYFQSGELEAEYKRKCEAQDAAANGTAPVLHDDPSEKKEVTRLHDDHVLWGISAHDKSCTYFVGIVDCFTTFDRTRSISYFFEGSTKSNVPPDLYAKRFYNVNKGRFA